MCVHVLFPCFLDECEYTNHIVEEVVFFREGGILPFFAKVSECVLCEITCHCNNKYNNFLVSLIHFTNVCTEIRVQNVVSL